MNGAVWCGVVVGAGVGVVVGTGVWWLWSQQEGDQGKNQGGDSKDTDHCGTLVRDGLEGLIGETPMVELKCLSKLTGCRVLAKCEMLNPGGSSNDRVALNIILEAEKQGLLQKGGTIYEGTAGSTGISLALLARARGYRCVIVMADDMAMEKEVMLTTLGAEVRRVKAVSIVHRDHFCNVAKRLAEEDPSGFYANQFENLANARAHFGTTAREIWQQTRGRLDAFVMAAGTGGTISGVAQYLRQRRPGIHVALVDPPGSSLYLKVTSGVTYTAEQAESRLQRNRYDTITEGIGIDRLTRNFDAGLSFITHAFKGTDQEAVDMAGFLLQEDGIFVGSSSAMNCVGAVKMAQVLGPGHTIVTCLCDQGHRSMSKLYNPAYLAERELVPFSPSRPLSFLQRQQ